MTKVGRGGERGYSQAIVTAVQTLNVPASMRIIGSCGEDPRYISLIKSVTAEKLPYRSYGRREKQS